jgi:hypothetical protein
MDYCLQQNSREGCKVVLADNHGECLVDYSSPAAQLVSTSDGEYFIVCLRIFSLVLLSLSVTGSMAGGREERGVG